MFTLFEDIMTRGLFLAFKQVTNPLSIHKYHFTSRGRKDDNNDDEVKLQHYFLTQFFFTDTRKLVKILIQLIWTYFVLETGG